MDHRRQVDCFLYTCLTEPFSHISFCGASRLVAETTRTHRPRPCRPPAPWGQPRPKRMTPWLATSSIARCAPPCLPAVPPARPAPRRRQGLNSKESPTTPAPPLPLQVCWLNSGAFGSVIKAEDLFATDPAHRFVAIKLLLRGPNVRVPTRLRHGGRWLAARAVELGRTAAFLTGPCTQGCITAAASPVCRPASAAHCPPYRRRAPLKTRPPPAVGAD